MQALLVSSGEKGRAMLTELMRGAGPFDFTVAGSGSEARRLSAEMEYDLIVINAPLSDEYGDGLSMTLAMDTSSGILLLVRAENEDEVSSKVEDMGVMVLGKPLGLRNVLSGAEDGHGGAPPHDGAQERESPAAKEDR